MIRRGISGSSTNEEEEEDVVKPNASSFSSILSDSILLRWIWSLVQQHNNHQQQQQEPSIISSTTDIVQETTTNRVVGYSSSSTSRGRGGGGGRRDGEPCNKFTCLPYIEYCCNYSCSICAKVRSSSASSSSGFYFPRCNSRKICTKDNDANINYNGEKCGTTTCRPNEYCCNPKCNRCALVGTTCKPFCT